MAGSRLTFCMDLPSGFVTFLFTDIEGSSRLFRRIGDRYIGLLERHHELLRAAWAEHRGVEVKTEGDAFFVAFADASEAVRAAMAAQSAIHSEPWPDDAVLRVRIGMHSGLASPRDGDYIAYAVHQAARIVGAAHGGQILMSDETWRAVGGTLPELYSVGRYRIRDFDDPVELFQADPIGVPRLALPPRATPAMGHNLAQPGTSFVGRAKDLVELAALLEAGSAVSIVGPGGAGKTRLATELGLHIVDSWPDGVWMVELAALVTEAPLVGTVASTLGLSLAGRNPLDAIVADLAGRSAVIIFDNCEHLVEAIADLVDLLRKRVPSLVLLVTSREPLGISGERIWRVQPPAIPDTIELFIDRARSAGLGNPGTLEELAAVERICRRLDGNPLAIELAAARAASTGVTGLEAALDDKFRILSSRRRDLDPRQRSMTALLDWSYDLLLTSERVVLRRLSLFLDSFSLDGSERATVDPSLDSNAAIDAVWALVDKSLLVVDTSDNETRYRLPETVREYAARHLEEGEGRATAVRLGEWYLERFAPWVTFDLGLVSSARLELANITGLVAGLEDVDQQTAQLLAVSIAYVRDISGEVVEGIAELDGFLHRLTQPTVGRALLLSTAARLRYRGGDREFGPLLDEAEAILVEAGPEPPWAEGWVAAMRAFWYSERGDHASAVRVAETIGDSQSAPVARARRYNALGVVKGAGRRRRWRIRCPCVSVSRRRRNWGRRSRLPLDITTSLSTRCSRDAFRTPRIISWRHWSWRNKLGQWCWWPTRWSSHRDWLEVPATGPRQFGSMELRTGGCRNPAMRCTESMPR